MIKKLYLRFAPPRFSSPSTPSTMYSNGLVTLAVVIIVPVAWVFLASIKRNSEFYGSPWAMPAGFYWQNFYEAWTAASMGSYMLNSVIVTALALLLVVALPAVYCLSRFRGGGRHPGLRRHRLPRGAEGEVYSTYYTTRKDNGWARANPDEIQQCCIQTSFHTAAGRPLSIPLMKVNDRDGIGRWWEVMDRSAGDPLPPERWRYDAGSGCGNSSRTTPMWTSSAAPPSSTSSPWSSTS